MTDPINLSNGENQFNSEVIKKDSIISKPVNVDFDEKTGFLSFPCPHCDFYTIVSINEVACSIFRHGSFFINTPQGNVIQTQQIDPHTPKNICDKLVTDKKIIGCGKPLKMDKIGNSFVVNKCDYL